jgi:hypothetical protein
LVAWVEKGEDLLDLRGAGPFRGKGELKRAADTQILGAWQTGIAQDAAIAMMGFISSNADGIRAHAPQGLDEEGRREWQSNVSRWLHDTSHISLTYGVEYDGLPLDQLSPGTRGIVLLLLYLAIDEEDVRPLIIDQPEENLDPQSIFDELVPLFKEAKRRRQIVMVTHNANLVVNGDADQVVVATCGPHRPGQLPRLQYQMGSLENPSIRKRVCDILEGGDEAFRERARRLRLVL